MIPTLAQISPLVVTALVVVFLLVCIAMILLILIQRPQGGGLSGAFGAGGGAGQTAFGTKTGDVLTIVTISIFVLFLLTAIVLNFAARPSEAAPSGATIQSLGEPVAPDDASGADPTDQTQGADGAESDAPAVETAPDSATPETPAPETQPAEGDGTP